MEFHTSLKAIGQYQYHKNFSMDFTSRVRYISDRISQDIALKSTFYFMPLFN